MNHFIDCIISKKKCKSTMKYCTKELFAGLLVHWIEESRHKIGYGS